MRARLRPILLGMLLFLSGAALALLIEHSVIPRHRPPTRAVSHRAILTQLDDSLHLTPAQEESLSAIFARHQPLVDSAWHSINRRLGTAMDSVHRQVEAVLDSSQAVSFRRWMRRQHEAMRTEAGGRH
jgi:hypothetical protein